MANNDKTIFVIIGLAIVVAFLWQGGYLNQLFAILSDSTNYKNVDISNDIITYSSIISAYNSGEFNTNHVFSQYAGGNIESFTQFDKNTNLINFYLKNGLNIDANDFNIIFTGEPGYATILQAKGSSYSDEESSVNPINLEYKDILMADGWGFVLIGPDGAYPNPTQYGYVWVRNTPNDNVMVNLADKMSCRVYGTLEIGENYDINGKVSWGGSDGFNCIPNELKSGKISSGYVEFKIAQSINVYRLENNQCLTYIIKESEKLSTDYDTESECKLDIITSCNPNWQVGSWDTCSNSLQTRAVTDLNGCNNISNKPIESQSCTLNQSIQNLSVYRLSSNVCILISINPSDKTVNDYTTMLECQNKIKECLIDTDCASICGNKASVCTLDKCYCDNAPTTTLTTSTGSNGVIYSYSTVDTNAEKVINEKTFFDKYKWLIIGVIIIIGGIIFLYNRK